MNTVARAAVVIVGGLLLAGPVAGCAAVEETAREVTSRGLDERLRAEAEQRLRDAGIELEGDLDCTSDSDLDASRLSGSVKADCSGRTKDSQEVRVAFAGQASADSGCSGSLLVTVGSREVYRGDSGNICG